MAKTSKVIITGASGFIGTHIVNRLRDTHDLTLIDLKEPRINVGKFIQHDLLRPIELEKGIDVCIHLAAVVGGIQYFSKHPAENAYRNSLVLSNVFDACLKAGVRKIIYASSSVVYQFAKHFPTPENEISEVPPPSSAYGYTKLLGEYFCRAFRQEYGLNYTVLRPFNAYGPGEDPDIDYAHAIPQLVAKVLLGNYPVEIYGSGAQTRCFTYCTDIAEAFALCVSNSKSDNQVFNVSSAEETNIMNLLKMIWTTCGKSKKLKVKHLKPFPEDVRRRKPSVRKIHKTLGWKAHVRLADGLKETIEWLRDHPDALRQYITP